MTRTGFGFIAAGVFIYFVATQTQIGWLYLLDAVIWSLLVLSAVLPWFSLRSLEIEREIILPAQGFSSNLGGPVEDETVGLRLKLTNRGRVSKYFVTVVEDCPFEQAAKRRRTFFLPCLRPGSTTSFSYVATGYRRGYYALATAMLQSSDPLGLRMRRRTFTLPLNLRVYPTYYPMKGLPVTDPIWTDWGSAVKSRAANEFYSSREYQPGEPLKYIHWRNTARMGHFMLKEFEQAGQGSLAVAFKTGHYFGEGRETTLEYSIKIAASLSQLCANAGRSLDILAGEAPVLNAGWGEAMDYLVRLEKGNEASLTELTAVAVSSQTVVVVVPANEVNLIPVLRQLSPRFNRLAVVILEGFATDEIPDEFIAQLPVDNLTVIRGSRGNLAAAIEKLGNALLLAEQLPSG